MGRGRKSTRNYFGLDTEDAIIKYNESDDKCIKSKIYESEIHKPLNKLVENVIHKFKFYHYDSTYEDLKHEAVVYLHERLGKFSREKGKAFSYFTIVARNFLIVRSTENYSSITKRDPLVILDDRRDLTNEYYQDEYQSLLSDFMREWSEWGISNLDSLFISERDRQIAEAVFVIFRNCESIDNYNKKALYILIREHAKVKTQYITKVVGKMKMLFSDMVKVYMIDGVIEWNEYINKNRVN